ncbi:MAG: glycosyltransferase family 2 protein [Collinsella sp.]
MNLPEQNECTTKDTLKESAPISVVVPCYNCEEYIGACLDSLLSQELLPQEIICIDDGLPTTPLVFWRSLLLGPAWST